MDEYKFKICIFGESGVGKTTLTQRYLSGLFKENYKSTIGMDFYLKKLQFNGKSIKLQIWDFAGEEKYRFLLPGAVQGANGTIFMYDITRDITLRNLKDWFSVFDEANKTHDQEVLVMLVGSKLDLEKRRVVSKREGINFAKKNRVLEYIECSSKTGENVDYIFEKMTQRLLKRF